MIGTFVLFSLLSFRNRLVHRLRRLKQPRYLFSTLIGLAYFAWLVIGNSRGAVSIDGHRMPLGGELILIALTVVSLVVLLGAWAWPGSAAGVTFTGSEIQFLFPAPLSRSQLLLYKVTRSQPGILFGAFMLWLFLVRGGHFLGVWLAIVVFDLYLLMVAFGRARLRQFGVGFPSRVVIVAFLFVASFVVTWHGFAGMDAGKVIALLRDRHLDEAGVLLGEFLFRGASGAVYLLPSVFARPAVASSVPEFLQASILLVAIGLVCFRLAAWFDVSFEDASIEASKKKAEKLARHRKWQHGTRVVFRRTPALFRLAESGPPEVAIVWKNLIAGGRITLPLIAIAFVVVAIVIGVVALGGGGDRAAGVAASISLLLLAMLSFAGPLMVRNDLRLEVDRLDLLRLLPIAGPRMVAAELVAPALIIFVLQVGLLSSALVLYLMVVDHATWLKFALWSPAVLVMAIPIDLVQLLFQNGMVILFPAWARMTKDQSRGAEGIGRGILLMLGHLLFFVVGLLPAALVFAIGFWLASFLFDYGPAAGTIAAVPASMVLWFEVVMMVRFLGSRFEEIDVSNDLEPWES